MATRTALDSHIGRGTDQTVPQTGDNNNAVMDCLGERCDMTVTQDGDGNTPHAELGNPHGHNDNKIVITLQKVIQTILCRS